MVFGLGFRLCWGIGYEVTPIELINKDGIVVNVYGTNRLWIAVTITVNLIIMCLGFRVCLKDTMLLRCVLVFYDWVKILPELGIFLLQLHELPILLFDLPLKYLYLTGE